MTIPLTCYIAGCLGSIYLFVGPSTRCYHAGRPSWVARGLRATAFFVLAWAILGLAKLLLATHLSPSGFAQVDYWKTALGGIGLGMLVMLVLSGELRSPRRCKELKRGE